MDFPIEENHKLAPATRESLDNTCSYRQLAGHSFLAITRSVLTYTMHVLSQFMHCPKVEHMDVACHILS